MKFIYTIIIALFFTGTVCAQDKKQIGEKFQFDVKYESDPQFVLTDNYNAYLLSVVEVDGLANGHHVIIRKFDQKSTMVNSYKCAFPKIDESTLCSYLGFTTSNTGKVAVFIEGHSGKAAKSELYKLEFDKTTEKFTTTVLATHSIISLFKSGNASLQKSHNGRYVGIIYTEYREKEQPEKNTIIMLDAATLSVAWQKQVAFENEFTSQNFVVTNSGKMVIARDMKGSKKGITYLAVVTAGEQEEKNFETQVFLNEMMSVSIGSEDYLIALNSDSKNFRSDYYNNLMLYDLKQGKVLNNNKIKEFATLKDLFSVSIRNITIQNNQIDIFTEALTEVKTKPTSNNYMSTARLQKKYNFGPAYIFSMALDGQLKTPQKLTTETYNEAYLHHSFGFWNVKGTYYINTGAYMGVYTLNPVNLSFGSKAEDYLSSSLQGRYINQLFAYFPDSKTMLVAAYLNDNQMSLIRVLGRD